VGQFKPVPAVELALRFQKNIVVLVCVPIVVRPTEIEPFGPSVFVYGRTSAGLQRMAEECEG
jgi:hypothetical protein